MTSTNVNLSTALANPTPIAVLPLDTTKKLLVPPDPYLTSGGTRYDFTAVDCEPLIAGDQACSNPIQAAVNFIPAHLPDDRTLYIEGGVFTENVTLSNFTPLSIPSFTGLTLRGGVNGSPTIIDGFVSIFDSINIALSNLTINRGVQANSANNLTLNNLSVTNIGGAPGININNSNTITLANVQANNVQNGGPGALLQNNSGPLIIANSTFNNNSGTGVVVQSHNGDIHVSNTEARLNQGLGANLMSDTSLQVVDSHFDLNFWTGLQVDVAGPVTLSGVNASENGQSAFGSCCGDVAARIINNRAAVPAPVTLSNSVFESNTRGGLEVYSRGDIGLDNIVARNNYVGDSIDTATSGGTGAYLNNSLAGGTGNVLIENSAFNANFYDGLTVQSAGSITVRNVNGMSNRGQGASLQAGSGGTIDGATGEFSFNRGNGLGIYAQGNVSLRSVTARANGMEGIYIDNCYLDYMDCAGTGGVSVRDGVYQDNAGNGLSVRTGAGISVGSTAVFGNDAGGANLDGCAWSGSTCAGTGEVSVEASDFSENNYTGLNAQTGGNIRLTGVTANASRHSAGAALSNCFASRPYCGGTGNVEISTSTFDLNAFSGLSVNSAGYVTLLDVHARQNGQNFYDPMCPGCGDVGARIDNHLATVPSPVTVSNGVFGHNTRGGLQVYSMGAITLSNVQANDNLVRNVDGQVVGGGSGAMLDNSSLCLAGDQNGCYPGMIIPGTEGIQVSASEFSRNEPGPWSWSAGLTVQSIGSIILTDVIADDNESTGARLYGRGYDPTPMTCNSSGQCFDSDWSDNVSSGGDAIIVNSTFNDNRGGIGTAGLGVFTFGNIVIRDVIANGNGDLGAELDNCAWTGSGCLNQKDIVVVSSMFNQNQVLSGQDLDWMGALRIHSSGDVTLTDTIASGNHGQGMHISAENGMTTIANIDADNNEGRGVRIDSVQWWLDPTPQTCDESGCTDADWSDNTAIGGDVTVVASTFRNNGSTGLDVYAGGLITVRDLTAINNGRWFSDPAYTGSGDASDGAGAILTNGGNTISHPGVTVTTSDPDGLNVFDGNGVGGLVVRSLGKIVVNNVQANNNHGRLWFSYLQGDGVRISNDVACFGGGPGVCGYEVPGTGDAEVANGIFVGNYQHGLSVSSHGAILVTDVTANNNGQAFFDPPCSGCTNGGTGVNLSNNIGNEATPRPVTINVDRRVSNIMSGNFGAGLSINSAGDIIVNHVQANDNVVRDVNSVVRGGGAGATLNNGNPCTYGTLQTGCITFGSGSGSIWVSESTFNGNYHSGLSANSAGAITVRDIQANWNGQVFFDPTCQNCSSTGVSLNGNRGNPSAASLPTVIVDTSSPDIWNVIENNSNTGLEVNALGNISVRNVRASNNVVRDSNGIPRVGNLGARLVNADSCATRTTLSGCPAGKMVWGRGDVLVENSIFDGNYRVGLQVNSTGTITANHVQANWNGQAYFTPGCTNCWSNGALLYNNFNTSSTPPPVVVNYSTFNHNNRDGLVVYSRGDITVTHVQVMDNVTRISQGTVITGNTGSRLNNGYTSVSGSTAGSQPNAMGIGSVLVEDSVFDGHYRTGLQVDSTGNIILRGVSGTNNTIYNPIQVPFTGGSGTILNNAPLCLNGGTSCATPQSFGTGTVLVENSTFTYNYQSGLTVHSTRAITLNNVHADNNVLRVFDPNGGCSNCGLFGAALINAWGYPNSPSPVVVTASNGLSTFNDNGHNGLGVFSIGDVILSQVEASRNAMAPSWYVAIDYQGYGAVLNNGLVCKSSGQILCSPSLQVPGTGTFTISDSRFESNYYQGVNVFSNKSIAVSDVTATGNGFGATAVQGKGATFRSTGESISVAHSTFSDNAYRGFVASTDNGVITIQSVTATGNPVDNLLRGNLADSSKVQIIVIATDGADAFTFENQVATVNGTVLNVDATNTLTLVGSGGDDVLMVSPSMIITINVDGGPHPLGDTLIFDALGLPVTANGGAFYAAGHQPVNYVRIENLDYRNVLLTVAANNTSKTYGAPVPTLTATYTGFLFNDDASVLTTPTVLTTTATLNSPAGMYAITVSGATASNYAIAFVDGTLQVTSNSINMQKQEVLSSLNSLLTVTSDRQDDKRLGEAIKHLTKSLDSSLWLDDGNHLQVKHGEKVFAEEKDAVNKLSEIIKDKDTTLSKLTIQGMIDSLVEADRSLALTAIAGAVGGDSKMLAKANEEFAKAASDVSKGKYDSGIEHYRNAWKFAMKSIGK